MRNLKAILAVLLLALSLLDCFDTCILTAMKSSSNATSQTCNALIAQHHHHQEEIVLEKEVTLIQPLEKQQLLLPDSNQLAASTYITSIWQPPKAA
jgi:hypothetical protein